MVIKYLLENSCENSRTWAIHLRNISKMYKIEDPLDCLNRSPPSKDTYKSNIITKILSFHENELRKAASTNEMMKYLNVSTIGLRGRPHPAISNVTTTHDVRKMRPHIKMLTGNYLTLEEKSFE